MVCAASDEDTQEKTVRLDQEAIKRELNKEREKAKEGDPCLIVIRGPRQGDRFFLKAAEMNVGRDPGADISIGDPSISRKHAKFVKNGDKVQFTDLGSSNGSFVNEKKVEQNQTVDLAKEDMVKIGNVMLKFLPAGELEIGVYGTLESKAHTDPMTRIFNKGYLTEAIEAEYKRAKALHSEFTVLFFDLDHFKKVNDTYGHDAGDYVLKEFANLVRTGHLRPKDIFARYGGEEFVVLLANTGVKVGAELAEKVRAAVEAHPFLYEGKRLPVTTSMGVVELRAEHLSGQDMLKAADKALYQSKQGGRNRVTIATSA
jgi:diguanylate cyclase (GGDEF)-like protein